MAKFFVVYFFVNILRPNLNKDLFNFNINHFTKVLSKHNLLFILLTDPTNSNKF